VLLNEMSSMRPIGARSSPRNRAPSRHRHSPQIGYPKTGHTQRLAARSTQRSCAYLASCQIDHAQAVVAELRYKQSLPLHIDAEVISAAAHVPERYLCLETWSTKAS
jgi:hypothetical protein